MTKEDIIHLASLARIKLTDEELTNFEKELPSILAYVSAVTDMVESEVATGPLVGATYNVLRDDVITNAPATYTSAILAEMPHTEGKLMKVRKILQIDE